MPRFPYLWTFLRLVYAEWASLVTGSFSAGLIVLGFAISIASALGKPILGGPIVQLATWVLAVICGGVAAFSVWTREHDARMQAEARLVRPELDIEFDPENIPECRLGSSPVMQFRMKVSNFRSGKTVRNCQGRIEFVERPSLAKSRGPYVEKVPLTWALQTNQHRTDLQDGQSLPLNVILVGLSTIGGQPVAQFISMPDANNAPHPFDTVGEYRCVVAITSDDTRPKYVDFVFDWTGNPSTARIKKPVFADKWLA
jgi:hypothetical protein